MTGLALMVAFPATCAFAQERFYGDSLTLGQGVVTVWTEVDTAGNPARIGVTFTYGALTGISGQQNLILRLPDATNDELFDHVFLNWNPSGHDPGPIYGRPHFDIHFVLISVPERQAISGGVDNVPVDPLYLPPNYSTPPPPFAVPQMGVHYSDSTSPEFHGVPFTTTMILGYFRGQFIFVEPMITRAFLQSQPDTTIPIPQPQAYQREGYYPTTYSIRYDPSDSTYNVTIEHFTAGEIVPVAEEPPVLPAGYALLDNYPNPFNPTTTIGFHLPRSSDISLKLFNVLGEEVATIAEGPMAEGMHHLRFDGRGLAAGIYFYRLQAGEFRETKRMLLLK